MLKEKFKSLTSEQKTKVVRISVISGVVLLALGSYYATGQDKKHTEKKVEVKTRPITLGDELLKDDVLATAARDRDEQNSVNTNQNEKIDAVAKQQAEQFQAIATLIDDLKKQQVSTANRSQPTDEDLLSAPDMSDPSLKFPPPPSNSRAQKASLQPAIPAVVRTQGAARNSGSEPEPLDGQGIALVGGIGHVEGERNSADTPNGTKKNRTVYLPPSFMEAKLLTGLKAKTVSDAKSNPEPIMVRIQAPAVLPNDVKADLEGCFLVGNGFGSLSTERVDVRLVSLHCTANNGQVVIDSPVKGVLVDSDGSAHLAGRPVSKMGANMARAFLAKFLEGFGGVIEKDALITSVNPLGSTTTVSDSAGSATKAGIGGGINAAAKELSTVYLDLVRQSAPVIEIGPTKAVTAMIIEGVKLEIKDYENKDE